MLVICTANYRKRVEDKVSFDEGRGAFWEGALIHQYIYEEKGNTRFIPVLIDDAADDAVPFPLRPFTRYRLKAFDMSDPLFKELYDELIGHVARAKPVRGAKVVVPPSEIPGPIMTRPSMERAVEPTMPDTEIDDIELIIRDAEVEDEAIHKVEAQYFNAGKDREARELFEALAQLPLSERLSAPHPKRLLVFFGVHGLGKTTLLKICRRVCRRNNIPVAMCDTGSPSCRVVGALGKSAEVRRCGVAHVPAHPHTLPPLGIVVGAEERKQGVNQEVFNGWLNAHLKSQADVKLWRDPLKPLTDAFVNDLAKASSHQKLVLLIDIQRHLTSLDDWLCSLAQRLPERVLLVMARLR